MLFHALYILATAKSLIAAGEKSTKLGIEFVQMLTRVQRLDTERGHNSMSYARANIYAGIGFVHGQLT